MDLCVFIYIKTFNPSNHTDAGDRAAALPPDLVEDDADDDSGGDNEKADSIPSIVRRPGAVEVEAADDALRFPPRHSPPRRRRRPRPLLLALSLPLPPELGVVPPVSRLDMSSSPLPLLLLLLLLLAPPVACDDPSSDSRKSPRVSAPRPST